MKAKTIAESYAEHKEYANTVVALSSLDLSPSSCMKLYKAYGQDAVATVQENPYRLIDDVYGIGFARADKIAQKIGIAADSPFRIRSAVVYALNARAAAGDTYAPETELTEEVAGFLDVPRENVSDAIFELALDGKVFKEVLDGERIVSLYVFRRAERFCAAKILQLCNSELKAVSENTRKLISQAERSEGIMLSERQKLAVGSSLKCGVSIITGGPGTGKTYTIIQRLIYLLEHELCAAEEIYILCYTRSAKKVVESKIEEAVTEGRIPPSASGICILTFDSYATYFLMAMKEDGVITEDFSGYDYNERIRLFNKHISAEDLAEIRYFIVDEIQELANDRARMVMNILQRLQCGYLLAGDRCQSIYDYEADDDATLDSVKFYALAEQQFPKDMLRYEINVNRRQTPALAEQAAAMRQVLLNEPCDVQNRCANEVMKRFSDGRKIKEYIKELTEAPSVPTAILCRNNGEAEYISGLLCRKRIPHTLNRGVNNAASLPRWIADVFWDYCREIISRQDFLERFRYRVQGGMDAEEIWQSFLTMTHAQDPSAVNVTKLSAALGVVNNVPSFFYEQPPMLTVSTIHKAKGSEYDSVILIASEIPPSQEGSEEARIRYVALTRPKAQLVTMIQEHAPYYLRQYGFSSPCDTCII